MNESNCCQENDKIAFPEFNVKYINNILYITYGDKTIQIPIVSGGGGNSGTDVDVIIVPIGTDLQVYFSNVIPVDREVLWVTVNGHPHYAEDYEINVGSFTWKGEYSLETTDTLAIITKK